MYMHINYNIFQKINKWHHKQDLFKLVNKSIHELHTCFVHKCYRTDFSSFNINLMSLIYVQAYLSFIFHVEQTYINSY